MDAFIDIVTDKGEPTGKTALKSIIHKKGYYHNTIHLWLFTDNGEILLQQRSRKKAIYPLLWDVSVAGHIDAGETFVEAAIRETKEEIGLDLNANDLIKIGINSYESSYNNGAILDNEFHHVYIAKLNSTIDSLILQKNEVEALKLVSFSTFKNLLEHSATNGHFISTNLPYYKFVLETIKTHSRI